MMLRTFLPKPEQRFAAAGAALGALVSAAWLATETVLIEQSTTHWDVTAIVAAGAMPFLLGGSFYRWRYSRRLERELFAARRAERRLRHEVHRDKLTGLANRAALEADIRQALCVEGAAFERKSLLLLDLDRFKSINDTLGHDAGDRLLALFGARLRRAFAGEATVYRLGGDEFVVAAAGASSQAEAEMLATRVERLFELPFDLGEAQVASGCSIGIAFIERTDISTGDVLKRADLALYEAKAISGNSHAFHSETMSDAMRQRAEAERDLVRGFAQEEFFLEFLPIAGGESGVVRGFESLLRWRHPLRGVIGADAFEPPEQSAFTLSLGAWALQAACRQAASWPSPTGLTVVPFASQLRDRDFVVQVQRCLLAAGLPPGRLTIEVAEGVSTEDLAVFAENLRGLRVLGVRVALGGGSASSLPLNQISDVQPDQVTVDLAAVRAAHGSERSVALLACLIKTGQVLRLAIGVSGVEKESEADCARACGAAELRGPWISPPIADVTVLFGGGKMGELRRTA
ncbi:MAG TPA: EAL domain-containing protein [Ensifer sp.]|jgi:diguanylate cyclase (GGDEF)-like protein|uniref:putative bifunctional diguanylate cyclase/phosphodiesterase n=1 Tax=Ensifer sp. TaxID=1872086 RepID=UPI002E167A56|nr:EAL domain-containing protein [Ensifer sp.]